MTQEKILIIRTSAIGDVVMSSHLADGLRSKYPDAGIYWLAEPQVAPLLVHHPALDGVIEWPKTRWKGLLKAKSFIPLFGEARAFISRLRKERFTLAIDAQGLLRTRILARVSGASRRIGFDSREAGKGLMTTVISKGGDDSLMGSEYFHLLGHLGVDTGALAQSLTLGRDAHEEAAETLARCGVDGPYVVFAPFTTRPQKHWFEQQWVQLAREMARTVPLPVLWLGGPGEAQAAERLALEGGGVNMAGKTTLSGSAAVIARASLLVGVDTGLTHMGTAFRIPTVAMFGSTCPYTRTCSPNTVVLYHPMPCSPCRRSPTCNGAHDCMRAITVDEVMDAVARFELPGATR